MSSIALAAFALSLAPATFQDGGCNDTNRTLAQSGGVGDKASTTCTSITLGSIAAGGTVSTPSSCTIGYRVTEHNLYTCGGALPDVHCNPFKYECEVTVYSGGGCPSIPPPAGYSIPEILAFVPRAFLGALTCTPPKATSTNDPSAGITPCGDDYLTPLDGDPVQRPDGSAYGYWWHGPDNPGPASSTLTFNPFITEVDSLEGATGADFSGLFGSLATYSIGALGAELDATVRIRHFDAASSSPSNDYLVSLSGQLTSDGRFDVLRVRPNLQADNSPILHETSFDGFELRNLQAGAEAGSVHALSSSSPEWIADHYLLALRHAYRWLVDPYDLALIQGATYIELLGAIPGTATIERVHADDSGFSFVGERYQVDTSAASARPLSLEILDPNGAVWRTREFADFFRFRTADWRPATTRSTIYLDGSAAGRRVEVTLAISSATELTAAEAAAVPGSIGRSDQPWNVWTQY